MTEYSTGLLHGIALSVVADVISNFITLIIAHHIFTKKHVGSVFNAIKNIFNRK